MEEGVHIHPPHSHEVEERAEHGERLSQRVAIFTAVLATIGAVVSFFGGHTQNVALLHKNEAILMKTQASDQWNFYQAKSQKEHLASLAAELVMNPEKKAYYLKQAQRYEREKLDIQKQATFFEHEYEKADKAAEEALHPHEKLSISITLLQIAIALASVTALTRKRWLMYGAAIAALIGSGLGGLAYFL